MWLLLNFFRTLLYWCAALFAPILSSWTMKVSVLFFRFYSSVVPLQETFLFRIKEKSFFSIAFTGLFSGAKNLRNCTIREKELKNNKFGINFSQWSVRSKFTSVYEWLFVCRILPFVRLFLKLLHCKVSCGYHILLHAYGVLPPFFCFFGYIKVVFRFLTTFSVFLYGG